MKKPFNRKAPKTPEAIAKWWAERAAEAAGKPVDEWIRQAITRQARRQLGWISDEKPCECKRCAG